MILQVFFDWATAFIADLIKAMPAPPSGTLPAIQSMTDALTQIGSMVSIFGIVIPFSTVNFIIGLWIATIPVWGTLALVRVILWALGR